ncbi:Prolyl 4-hydroxylase, alpha polypeptide [Cichlidogyrus casuarinus]|uniref:Prolyl 4-hydroxylase, alpha polypeptide n=1 Tax=Cichlidogyrus casuarinus TaxID=1844966 RepID=A0ABD2Q9A4_9PLAT
MRLQLFGFLAFLSVIKVCRTETFTALVDLGSAVDASRDLASDLTDYLNLEEQRLAEIRKLVESLQVSKNSSNSEELLTNPVKAYLTLSQLSKDWETDLNKLIGLPSDQNGKTESYGAQGSPKLMEVLTRMSQKVSMLPGGDDLVGAVDALLRLQNTYKLDPWDMAEGRLTKDVESPKLNSGQCQYIAQRAYKLRQYVDSEKWFKVALKKYKQSKKQQKFKPSDAPGMVAPSEDNVSMETILDGLAYALGRQGLYKDALRVTKELIAESE